MITRLLDLEKTIGDIEGICVACGMHTTQGLKYPFSSKFNGWSYLFYGNCCCPFCHAFFKEQQFRRKSWLFSNGGLTFIKRRDFEQLLTSPPNPPFFLYLTTTGQKQGWLSALRVVNISQESFILSTDKWGNVSIQPRLTKNMNSIIKFLRGKKVTKGELNSGDYSMNRYKTALIENWDNKLNEAKKYARTPSWEVMVYVAE